MNSGHKTPSLAGWSKLPYGPRSVNSTKGTLHLFYSFATGRDGGVCWVLGFGVLVYVQESTNFAVSLENPMKIGFS